MTTAWLLFAVFTVAGLTATAAAWTGWSGEVGIRGVGPDLPARVLADPGLVRRANRLVTRWCTAAAVMSVPPLVWLAVRGLGDREPLPLWQLVAVAAYGFVFVLVAGYPFERIRGLADA
jgi:hypothetical protein